MNRFRNASPLASDQTGLSNNVSNKIESKKEFGWLQAKSRGPSQANTSGFSIRMCRTYKGSRQRDQILSIEYSNGFGWVF